ncbi:MAG: hypothetical protein AABY40_04475 [Nanoarchaeota archaeon]
MARILVGGPGGQKSNIHDDLVSRLRLEHDVTYLKNDGKGMLWELSRSPFMQKEQKYGLILYDSNLFYPEVAAERKIIVFEELTAKYLAIAQAPVIVLAEMELAIKLRPSVEKAGFMQIDQPYQVEEVSYKVKEILQKAAENAAK